MMMCRHSSFYLFWLSFSHTYPKYMIGRAACSGLLLDTLVAHSDINFGGGGASFTRFSLLEINYFPGGKDSLWKCKIQDKLQVKLSPLWHWGYRDVHVASDRSESSFQMLLLVLQHCNPFSQCLLALQCLYRSLGPHPASAPGPLGADMWAWWSWVAGERARSRFIPPCTAVPFGFGNPLCLVSPKHGLRTDHANHIFYFFNTLCYGRRFVASDTLCYVFLLKIAAPAAGRVSVLVSLASEVY